MAERRRWRRSPNIAGMWLVFDPTTTPRFSIDHMHKTEVWDEWEDGEADDGTRYYGPIPYPKAVNFPIGEGVPRD